jgi:NitT/TauT family transport system substrate-binding protein
MSKLPHMLLKRRSRRYVAGLAIAAAALVSAGCATGMAATSTVSIEKRDLVIATVPTASSAGLYIAQQQGFFRQAGLNVKIVSVGSGAGVTADLLNGGIDVLNGAYAGFIAAQAHGAGQFRVLADGYAGAPHVDEIVVMPGSGITTPAQLKGKTVAVNALGSIAALLVSSSLAADGVPQAQVHMVAVPFPDMPAALTAHRVDAAYLAEPYVSQVEAQVGGQELLDINQGATQDFPISGYVATQRWCQRYPKTAVAFARAVDRGQAVADTSRPAVEKVLTAYTPIKRQIAAIMSLGNFPTSVNPVHVQRVADLMLDFGQLKQRFDVAAMTAPVGG